MSIQVWKFLVPFGETVHHAPPGAMKPVLVGRDPATGNPAVWYEVRPHAAGLLCAFRVFGTGQSIDDDRWSHVGSYVDGGFVWHIYRSFKMGAEP
ncbi:MAG: hypothetical protein GY871_04330 [Actinomycetales bacterium]|nr:hypothetical protein [Actinomycetales bacterium]